MSTGLPLIASDVGYNKEIVSSDIGFLISNNRTTLFSDLKKAIIQISKTNESWLEYSTSSFNKW